MCAVLVQNSVWAAKDNSAAYLKSYYGVSFDGDVSAEEFNAALIAMGADPVETDKLTLAEAAIGAVRLAGMEELANVYAASDLPLEAVEDMEEEDIKVDETARPYVLCALEMDLVDDDDDFTGPVSARTAANLLYRAAEIAGKGRHYIGCVSDDDILPKLKSVLDSVFIFDDETLNMEGIDLLISEATTGYSLKYSEYDARFLEENTLRYGHDTAAHLMQLIALMNSAEFDAYVQIEPKVSVYEYMLDWGEPKAPTPTYQVREMMEGHYFAFALEFDMALEFENVEEKEAFHTLVENYAKKYDDSFDEAGNLVKPLIASSWWQPLYFSSTEMENREFMPLIDNVITKEDSTFSIHSFSLPENAQGIAELLDQTHPELSVEARTIYANPAFYRYITDTDHQ